MHPKSPTGNISEVRARFERHVETLRRIEELVREEPDLIPVIVAALNGRPSERPSENGKSQDKPKTHFERLTAFFKGRNNAWATTAEIVTTTGISRGAIGAILHQGHKNDVQKKSKPGSRKTKLWRLKEGGDGHG